MMKGMGSLHQSDAWAIVQRNLGHQVLQGRGDGWRYLGIRLGGRRWPYLYCPSGPDAENPPAFDAVLAALRATAREQGFAFVRIAPITTAMCEDAETPEAALRRRGLHRSPVDMRPQHTQVVDLTSDVDTILKGMEAHNRKRYRNIHKKGVTFTTSTDPADIELLLPILNAVAERNRFSRKQDDYLREAARTLMPMGVATLYIAWFGETPVEVTLVYDWADTRIQAHGGVDYEHRRLNAGNAQTVRMILDAKAKGLTRFDLWGTAPEGAGPEHEWYGFTKFKKSFGGHPETYPGTWDLPVRPVQYAVLRAEQMIRKKVTRIPGALHRHVHVRGGAMPAPDRAEPGTRSSTATPARS